MKRANIEEFYRRLAEADPEPQGELNYVNVYTLLVAVVLSAQATDVGVNKATAKLFPVANTPEAIVELGEEGLKRYIKTIGLFNTKAKNVHKLSQILIDEHGGEVPADRAALVETLTATAQLPRRRILVFAASGDKQLVEMLREARRLFTVVVLTRYATNPRAATLVALRQAAEQAGWQEPLLASSPAEAIELARKLAAGRGLICVAGSFFLAAEARAALAAAGLGPPRR